MHLPIVESTSASSLPLVPFPPPSPPPRARMRSVMCTRGCCIISSPMYRIRYSICMYVLARIYCAIRPPSQVTSNSIIARSLLCAPVTHPNLSREIDGERWLLSLLPLPHLKSPLVPFSPPSPTPLYSRFT